MNIDQALALIKKCGNVSKPSFQEFDTSITSAPVYTTSDVFQANAVCGACGACGACRSFGRR